MSEATIQIIISAISPIALLIVGAWLKRSADARAAQQVAAVKAAEKAAAGAEALARENIRQAVATHDTLKNVESNVNGRLSRQTELYEISQTDAMQMRTQLANVTVLLAQLLEKQPDAVAKAKEVLAEPIPPPPDLPPPMVSIPAMPDPEK